MIRHMRHGSPPRLMALQSILSPNRRESLPTPSAGVRISRVAGQPELPLALNSLSRLHAHEAAVRVVVSKQGRNLIAGLEQEHARFGLRSGSEPANPQLGKVISRLSLRLHRILVLSLYTRIGLDLLSLPHRSCPSGGPIPLGSLRSN